MIKIVINILLLFEKSENQYLYPNTLYYLCNIDMIHMYHYTILWLIESFFNKLQVRLEFLYCNSLRWQTSLALYTLTYKKVNILIKLRFMVYCNMEKKIKHTLSTNVNSYFNNYQNFSNYNSFIENL